MSNGEHMQAGPQDSPGTQPEQRDVKAAQGRTLMAKPAV